MCPFVEKKKKAFCLVEHISTKKPPTFSTPSNPPPPHPPPIIPTYPIINNYYNVHSY